MNTAEAAHLIADLAFVIKQAEALPHPGYMGHSMQSYLPVHERREFTPEEAAMIEQAQRKLIPKIFTSLKDSPSVEMSSPGATGLATGGVGALLGALAGAGLGSSVYKSKHPLQRGANPGTALGSVLGALLGGGGAGAIGYHARKAKNEDLEEMMSRLPQNATRRDMMADPVYQAERERAVSSRNTAALAAALAR